ncbi:MAG: hypothetical protein M3Q71_00660 [Chloroflexota bacterium]|nr:hypothetical protein [Chloroflexota bacterium]
MLDGHRRPFADYGLVLHNAPIEPGISPVELVERVGQLREFDLRLHELCDEALDLGMEDAWLRLMSIDEGVDRALVMAERALAGRTAMR